MGIALLKEDVIGEIKEIIIPETFCQIFQVVYRHPLYIRFDTMQEEKLPVDLTREKD